MLAAAPILADHGCKNYYRKVKTGKILQPARASVACVHFGYNLGVIKVRYAIVICDMLAPLVVFVRLGFHVRRAGE